MSPHATRLRGRVPVQGWLKSLIILFIHRWLSLGHHGGVPPPQALLRHGVHRGPVHSPPSMMYMLRAHCQHHPQRAQPVDPIVVLKALESLLTDLLGHFEPWGFRNTASG